FLNLIADILIPDKLEHVRLLNDFERLDFSVPTLLFKRKDRSSILKSVHDLNPIHLRSPVIDNLIIELNTLSSWKKTTEKYILDVKGKSWLLPFADDEVLTHYSFTKFSK